MNIINALNYEEMSQKGAEILIQTVKIRYFFLPCFPLPVLLIIVYPRAMLFKNDFLHLLFSIVKAERHIHCLLCFKIL